MSSAQEMEVGQEPGRFKGESALEVHALAQCAFVCRRMCVRDCSHACVWMHIRKCVLRPEANVGCLSQPLFVLLFQIGSLINVARMTAWLATELQGDLLVSAS